MSIRVAHYLSTLGLGGTDKTAMIFARSVNKAEFETFFFYKNPGERLEEFQGIFGGDLIQVSSNQDFREKVASLGPQIFHVYRSGYKEFPQPGVNFNVPRFVETNVFGSIDVSPLVSKTLFMSHWLFKHVLGREFNVNDSGIPPRFDYLNNPVDAPMTNQKMDLGLPDNAIVLGRCGRPDDGIYDNINVVAAYRLREAGYPIHFLVMAPPPAMTAELKLRGVPHTIVEPTVDPMTLSKFYNTVDIYCHARADGETFGCNIAEAMIHSKPVVTHIAVPSHPGMGVFQSQTELVVDKMTGFVTKHDSVVYMEAVEALINNPDLRKRMGRMSYTRAMSNYHTPVVIEKLERIYREIL